jgi:uncharacterized damage-inducible protein DinB
VTLVELKRLFDYDKWATIRMLGAVAGLKEEQYIKDLGSSFGGIRGTLVHIYGADRLWLDRWKGQSPQALINEAEIPSFGRLRERWEGFRRELDEFLAALTDEKIQAPHAYTDTAGNPHREPLYCQMQHRVNHSTYHRGQVTTMLRQLDVKPIGTDLITYYREKGAR